MKAVKQPTLTRLHFWNEDKSCYVLTNAVKAAIRAMKGEGYECSKATNQSPEATITDTEMYF
jgi:hypothetical protein